jgi:hypothetical protein
MAVDPRPNHPQPRADVTTELHGKGLSSDVLRDAALAGHVEAISCTANDVVTRQGYVRWGTPLRYLGDHYAAAGWTRERPKGFELLVHPDRTMAVGVAPGDHWTGIELDPLTGKPRMPHSRIDRGPMTAQIIVGNRDQMSFDAATHPAFAPGLLPGLTTWLLLHYWHEDPLTGQDELRLELSVPVEFSRNPHSDRGFITRFEPRLILPSIALGQVEDHLEDEDDGDETIDIEISRR